MKLHIFCEDCCFAKKKEDMGNPPWVVLPFREDGKYEFSCILGHNNRTILVGPKYQILVEGAIQAILDGYYIESVAAFMGCFERFCQYYCEIISLRRRGDGRPNFTKAWKKVDRYSERQIGMFVGVHYIETGQAPALLDNDSVSFRNKVIHQGMIPTRDEAINFGQRIVDLIHPVLWELTDNYKEEISTDSIMRQRATHKDYEGQGFRISTGVYPLNPHNFQKIAVNVRQEADRRGVSSVRIHGMA